MSDSDDFDYVDEPCDECDSTEYVVELSDGRNLCDECIDEQLGG